MMKASGCGTGSRKAAQKGRAVRVAEAHMTGTPPKNTGKLTNWPLLLLSG